MAGETHQVVSAYELAMLSGERLRGVERRSGAKAQFLRWEIAQAPLEKRHIVSTLGPVAFNFVVEVAEPVRRGEHGVALFSAERQLMWARAERNLCLVPGVHIFSHSLPSLPLRPGAYQWQVSLWESGEMLDQWDAVPDMTLATESNQHYMDEWNGHLNLPSEFIVENERKSEHINANGI
jgi:hypothetical protein